MSQRIAVTRIQASRGWSSVQLGAIWQHRELLYYLCWRAIKVRYKQAAIGIGWVLLQPLLTMMVFTVIFGRLARLPSEGLPYSVFAFSALAPWMFFSQALSRAGVSLVGDSQLLTKVYFPRILILLAACTTPLLDFLLSFVLLLGIMASHGLTPSWSVLLLPVFMLFAWVTALAAGMWLAPLNVKYRDVGHALPFITQLWMYASPVLYSSTLIPEQWRPLYGLNPLVGVIEGFRWALLRQTAPDFKTMGVSAAMVLVLFIGGSIYFRRMERTFADVV